MTESPDAHYEPRESLVQYSFGAIDPRPVPEAKAANKKLFENPNGVLGIEVTIPSYAERCTLGNIDPQHTDGNVDLTAIEVSRTLNIPPNEASMVTVRPDLDSLGSMALLRYRANGGELTPDIEQRIEQIALSDKFAKGAWPGKSELPTKESPWPQATGSVDTKKLSGIAARISDFKVPIADRVKSMEEFLVEGKEPEGYKEKIEAERQDVIKALENAEIKIELLADGKIAYVETSHRAGTMIGYSQSPIVIAFNPTFKQGPGEPYEKYTICQYDGRHMDLMSAKNELAKLEDGWGGSPTIIGSPQGKSPSLTKEQIVGIIEKYIIS